ncbi:MAG TPA: ribosome biogenesis GTPase Der [bacterium]|nr:ribosome biogenesis GTPase Der [bacterium]HOL47713.1 ribosome biogenesis GTPase Der [bacterium]HPQ19065.1 ribosome biogenesis GTPase Der [bacterium]
MKPIISIIGRPNVGKSTLFNRIISKRIAITDETPGVTRDVLEAEVEWNNRKFILIDTGGIDFSQNSDIPFSNLILEKSLETINNSSVILFVVDGKQDLTPIDFDIKNYLIKIGKINDTILVINKMEFFKEEEIYKFYELGIDNIFIISALHGKNIGDLLDKMVENISINNKEIEEEIIKLAIIGKPNVGKSSLANLLLGKNKMIISPIRGTTRDAISSFFKYDKKNYCIIDTPGIRRKKSIEDKLEILSVNRAIKSIRYSDIVLFMIDAVENISSQDIKLISLIEEYGKGLIFLVNKWDLIEKDEHTLNNYKKELLEKLPYLNYIPILFISILKKQRTNKIMETVKFVYENYTKRIKTSILNNFLLSFKNEYEIQTETKKINQIKYITQIGIKPPFFALSVSSKEKIKEHHLRQFIKALREKFVFYGVPIKLKFLYSKKHKE